MCPSRLQETDMSITRTVLLSRVQRHTILQQQKWNATKSISVTHCISRKGQHLHPVGVSFHISNLSTRHTNVVHSFNMHLPTTLGFATRATDWALYYLRIMLVLYVTLHVRWLLLNAVTYITAVAYSRDQGCNALKIIRRRGSIWKLIKGQKLILQADISIQNIYLVN